MNKNIKVLIASVVIGIIYNFYVFSLPIAGDDGWGGIAQGIGFFYGIVALAVIFGLLGLVVNETGSSVGKKILQGLSWFGMSLVVMFILFLIIGKLTSPSRQAEWDKTHPQIQNYDKNAPNYKPVIIN